MTTLKQTIRFAPLVLVAGMAALFVSCEKKGPAEKAGEKVDNAIEELGK